MKYVEEAKRLAEKIKDSEYLNSKEKANIELFLKDAERFYNRKKLKRIIKQWIVDNILYYK